MSRHPSAADLAAFRYTLAARAWDAGDRSRATHSALDDRPSSQRLPFGAWPEERQHGIGYRMPGHPYLSSLYGPHARREAAAMRSRAFEAHAPAAYGTWHPHNAPAFRLELAHGIPFGWR